MKKTLSFFTLLFLIGSSLYAQPELRFVAGAQDTVRNNAHHFFRGMTEPGSHLTVNGTPFRVFHTGAFAAEVHLTEGNNRVSFVVTHNNQQTTRELDIYFIPRRAPQATTNFEIETAELIPNFSMISAGDVLRVRVKTLPGSRVEWLDGILLDELCEEEGGGVAGIFTGQFVANVSDSALLAQPIVLTMSKDGQSVSREISQGITVICPTRPLYVRTRGARPFLNYGLGQDRLGGSRMATLVEGIDLRVTGKVDNLYRVQLSENRWAWIPQTQVEPPRVNRLFRPMALSSSWSVRGDDNYDYVSIALSHRLPFRSFTEIDPNRIVVDIFGVATNTTWITQLFNTRAISAVNYEQIDNDVLRIFIDLNTSRHWGHAISYQGNRLVIRVTHEPRLRMRGMRIALDAGHGGAAPGAIGTTGMRESDVNMDITMIVKRELERRGAIVTLTRTGDYDLTMARRIELLMEQNPDIVVSIHNNAGGNPLTTMGVSTYYRHIGHRHLSEAILRRMLRLDVGNFGLVGAFNFSLNSLTEFPVVLVEGLFMSTPEDEAKLADPRFIRNLSMEIVRGIEDFIREAR